METMRTRAGDGKACEVSATDWIDYIAVLCRVEEQLYLLNGKILRACKER